MGHAVLSHHLSNMEKKVCIIPYVQEILHFYITDLTFNFRSTRSVKVKEAPLPYKLPPSHYETQQQTTTPNKHTCCLWFTGLLFHLYPSVFNLKCVPYGSFIKLWWSTCICLSALNTSSQILRPLPKYLGTTINMWTTFSPKVPWLCWTNFSLSYISYNGVGY